MHLLCGVLFFLLSPGVLLTIPPGSRGLFVSGQTSLLAAAIHAVVFVVVGHLVWHYVLKRSLGGALMMPSRPLQQRATGGITVCNAALDCSPGMSCIDGTCM